jgi:thiol-disulfide isomerase/thioredoxin
MKLWTVFCFVAFFSSASTALSQTKMCVVGEPLCSLDSTTSAGVSMQEIEKLTVKVEQFLSSDDSDPFFSTSNPHSYVNIADDMLRYPELLDLAEQVVKKGIEVNTIENLQRTFGTMFPDWDRATSEYQQKLEFGRLYSYYAWILWKQHKPEEALITIRRAMDYRCTATSDDYLRLGVIEYDTGKQQQGWEHIVKALMMDTIIEEQDPGYRLAISDIVTDKYGIELDPAAFVSEYRIQHAEMLPDLELVSLDGAKIGLDQYQGQVIFLNFFSPTCGSCQQEIPSLKQLYMTFSPREDVAFLFVLNKPDLKREALALLEQSGIHSSTIVTLESGSAYDLISAEPSIWIADKAGKVVFRHSGYEQGDELIYRRELSKFSRSQ